MSFQDPASPTMAGIVNLHHDLMFIITGVAVFVLFVMIRLVQLFGEDASHNTLDFRQIYNLPDKTVHGTVLEIV
jgi:heme/copper-type cytochrome/quinol oxidase subunit 2|tara:strand:- start:746 stop:967 length:222 start_codon:yes stop_codon:yes gene_type:complete